MGIQPVLPGRVACGICLWRTGAPGTVSGNELHRSSDSNPSGSIGFAGGLRRKPAFPPGNALGPETAGGHQFFNVFSLAPGTGRLGVAARQHEDFELT
jgi:hypothetical protein